MVIFTHTGKKNIYLLDGVSQAEIEEHKDRYGMIDWETVVSMYGTIINQYLDEDGDFIQLQDGTNTITYNAESGINYLSVSVYYRISYSVSYTHLLKQKITAWGILRAVRKLSMHRSFTKQKTIWVKFPK